MDYNEFYKKYVQFVSSPEKQERFRQAVARAQADIAAIVEVPDNHIVIKAAVIPIDMTTIKVNVNVNGIPAATVGADEEEKPLKINFLDHENKDVRGNIQRSMPW